MTRAARLAVAGLAVALLHAPAFAQSGADQDIVATVAGPVRGTLRDGVRAFRGIPYAQPPAGALRWAPPHPAAAWTEPLDATASRHACPGDSRSGASGAGSGRAGTAGGADESETASEDCLTLDVAAPPSGAGPRPVVVWLLGGGVPGRWAAQDRREALARAGQAVVVSVDSRRGVLGFLAHPALDAEVDGAVALADQRLALQWVQRTIAAFGGDPDAVTLAGESAGAAAVCLHLATPEASAGLFQRALIVDGGCAQPLRSAAESAAAAGARLAQRLGCGERAGALACLRARPLAALLAAAQVVAGADPAAFAPAIGGRAAPHQPGEAFATGRFLRVPIVMGVTGEAGRLAAARTMPAGPRAAPPAPPERLRTVYGSNAGAVARAYPPGPGSRAPLDGALADFDPAFGGACVVLRSAQLAARIVPVFVFELRDGGAPADAASPALPGALLAAVAAFTADGVPRARGVPPWRPLRTPDQVMRFAPGRSAPVDGWAAHNCAFWRRLYPQILG